MKRLCALTLTIAVAALTLFACGGDDDNGTGPTPTPTTKCIHVDAANTGGTEDGSLAHPYSTIEAALTVAAAGDTVAVAAGAYGSGVEINVPTPVIIDGAGKATTIVDGEFIVSGTSATVATIVRDLSCVNVYWPVAVDSSISTCPLIVRNCRLDSLYNPTLYVSAMHYAIYDSLEVIADVRIAHITCSSRVVVSSCTIGGFLETAYVVGDSTLLSHCAVAGNLRMVAVEATCFQADGCTADSVISSSKDTPTVRLTNNAARLGMSATANGVSELMLSDNHVQTGNLRVTASDAHLTTIHGNTLDSGVIRSTLIGDTLCIDSNTISGDWRGIDITCIANVHVTNNMITLPAATFVGSDPEDDTLVSIGIRAMTDNADTVGEISDNTVDGAAFGILWYTGSGARLHGNSVTGSETGLWSLAENILIDSNTVTGTVKGLYLKGSAVVIGNTISDCDETGIFIYGPPDPSLLSFARTAPEGRLTDLVASFEGNTITNNGGAGIQLHSRVDLGGGALGSSGGNTITGNGDWDVSNRTPDTVWAQYGFWDHTDSAGIDGLDIYDNEEFGSYGPVIFSPIGDL